MIRNESKGSIVCMNSRIISSLIGQTLGLMFSSQKNIIFVLKEEKRENIHNFFVFFPIDVLFLDNKKRVVEKKENFRPFHLYFGRNKARYILELKNGLASDIAIGDQLSF